MRPLYCLSLLDLRLLITPLDLVVIVLSVLPRFTTSDFPFGQWLQDTKGVIRSRKSRKDRQYNGHKIPFGILQPLYCLSLLDLRLLITPLDLVVIVLSALPRFTTSDFPFGIMWPLYCLSFLDLLPKG
jgi:hypothetical protein